MSISDALLNAASGLSVTSRQLDVVSSNVANALTEGYAVRRVETGSRGTASGVRVLSVERAIDPELTALRRAADADAAEGTIRADAIARLAAAIGELGSADSLVDRITAFERALVRLADAPDQQSSLEAASQTAFELATFIRSSSAAIQTERARADREISTLVTDANDAAKRIAELNARIISGRANSIDVSLLEDERERLVDRLGAIVPVRVDEDSDGLMSLRTDTGLVLVGLRARTLEFDPTPTVSSTLNLSEGTLSGLRIGNVEITPTGDGSQRINSGALSGLFTVRDFDGPRLQAKLDALAGELIQRFAEPTVDPTLTPGTPGLFNASGDVPTAPITPGIAELIDLDPRILPGSPELWRLRAGLNAMSPGAAASDVVPRAFVSALGVGTDERFASGVFELSELASMMRVNAEDHATKQETTRIVLADEEGRLRGVDTDHELQLLVKIEQTYAAQARVIQAVARLLDELNGAVR